MWRDLKHVILHSEGKTFLNVSYIFEDANFMEKIRTDSGSGVGWWAMENISWWLRSSWKNAGVGNLPQGTLHHCSLLGFPGYLEDVEGFGLPMLRSGCPCFPTLGGRVWNGSKWSIKPRSEEKTAVASQMWSDTKNGGGRKNASYNLLAAPYFHGHSMPDVFLGDTKKIFDQGPWRRGWLLTFLILDVWCLTAFKLQWIRRNM